MLIKGDEKNRGMWKIGIVDELFILWNCIAIEKRKGAFH